jgi:hypothetical protein
MLTVKELLEKLSKLPEDAIVCWDSQGTDYWFGSDVEVECWTKEDLLENVADESDCFEDLPDFKCLVRLV